MRTPILLAVLALAVGLLLPAGAVADVGGTDLPYKGSGSGDTTFNLATGEVDLVSTGNASHVGSFGFEQHGLLVPTGVGTFNSSFSWTLTAANGDRMFGTATGTVTVTDAIHSIGVATYTSSGGTGRFADATLTFVATVRNTRVAVDGVIATGVHEGTVLGRLSF